MLLLRNGPPDQSGSCFSARTRKRGTTRRGGIELQTLCCCFVKGHQTRAGAAFQQEERRKAEHGAGAFVCPGGLPPESWPGRPVKNLVKIVHLGSISGHLCARAAFPRNLGPGGLSKTSSKSYIWVQFRVIVVPGQRETTRHGAGGTELQTLCCYACHACFVRGHQTLAGAAFSTGGESEKRHDTARGH